MDNVFEANHSGIEITNVEMATKEPRFLGRVLERAARHVNDRTVIYIHPSQRRDNGWLEWSMVVCYHSGSKLYIGCIERRPVAEAEFHS